MENYSEIQKTIYSMLTENTGIAMMDSGGDDNRGWQRNQKKSIDDFINEPEIDYTDPEDFSVSLFHYLTNFLELDDICRKFNEIQKNTDGDLDDRFYGVAVEAGQYIDTLEPTFVGDNFNTYNYESMLSQVVQGRLLTINDDKYLIMQIHNGCDVRGGYTDAKLFRFVDNDAYFDAITVFGSIDGQDVSTSYNGYSLTVDDTNEAPVITNNEASLYLTE